MFTIFVRYMSPSFSGPHAMVREAFLTLLLLQKCSQCIVLQVRSDFNRVHQTATIIIAKITFIDNERNSEDRYHRKP